MAVPSALQPAARQSAPASRPTATAAPPQRVAAPGLRRRALRPGDVLALQRTYGNRAMQRLLQRDADDPAAAAATAAETADFERRLAAARAGLIEATQRDGAMFMARAGSLDEDLRQPLFTDAALDAGLRASFRGLTLLVARLRVGYRTQPSWMRHFTQAVRDKDTRTVADLLRAYSGLRDPEMGVDEVLTTELAGDPQLPELRRLAREPTGEQGQVSYINQNAHYQKGLQGQPPELVHGIPRVRYILQRTGGELRVVVRIRFLRENPSVPGAKQTDSPPADKLNDWRSGIESAWNNRFTATNGTTTLRIVFVPVWNADELPHYELIYKQGPGISSTGATGEWYSIADGTIIAHEFGHMIGNPDEYNLPATPQDIPADFGLSEEEKKRSSYQGITGQPAPHPEGGVLPGGNAVKDSIMGDYGRVHQRHVWPVLDHFNTQVKPQSEADYRLQGGAP